MTQTQNLVDQSELRPKRPLYFGPMRRFILVLLLAILPLQWSWAAVANVCQHEVDRTAQHLGHHGHEHASVGVDKVTDASSDDGVPETKTSFDADCHGHGFTALMGSSLVSPLFWSGGPGLSVYRCQIPDGSSDRLLRPPSSHLA